MPSRSLLRLTLAAAVAAAVAPAALTAQQLVNFDNLPPTPDWYIPLGYSGYDWTMTNTNAGPGAFSYGSQAPVGPAICRSAMNCIGPGYARPAGIKAAGGTPAFSFQAWVRGWNVSAGRASTATSLQIDGFTGACNTGAVFTQTVALGQSYQLVQLPNVAVSCLTFSPFGGTDYFGGQPGGYFLMDDITFNPAAPPPPPVTSTPEPATLVLLAGGLAALGLANRRRARFPTS